VESVVNQIVSKRFAKLQQMQWTKKGVHLVLQMRTQVLDGRLEEPSGIGIQASGLSLSKRRRSPRNFILSTSTGAADVRSP
jgi:hypothetical protein